jgi:hypothetical protein
MSEANAPCPPDHPLMKAWTAYQETEDFNNSLYWATTQTLARQERADEHGVPPEANRITEEMRVQYAKGSLWAAFMAGFNAGGLTLA